MRRVRLARRRRGLSSVVGAIFLVLIIVAGFNLVTAGLSYYENYSAVLSEKSRVEWERTGEDIELVDVSVSSGKFNLTIWNSGSFTVRLVRLWVTNETSSPMWHRSFDIDYYISPKDTVMNVGQSIGLYVNSSNGYVLKVVTERGNTVSFRLSPASSVNPVLTIYASPETPINNTDISIFFTVTNRETDADAIVDLIPIMNVTAAAGTQVTYGEGPLPASSGVLLRGSSAFFRWVYNVKGDVPGWIFFNATVQGAPQGNFAAVNITLTTVGFAEQSSLSLSSSNFQVGTPNPDGRMYWHRTAELDGYQMDTINPTYSGSYWSFTLSSSSTTVKFYMKNGTEDINVPAGNWRLHLDAYRVYCDECSMQIRVIYEVVSEDGQTVVETIDNHLETLWGDEYDWDSTTRSDYESAVTISAGDRIRLTIIHESGVDLNFRVDRMSSYNAYLETPDPDIPYPSYWTYDGDDYWITVTNYGDFNYWLTYQTRAVWSDQGTNESYASFLVGWQYPSGPPEYTIDEDHDAVLRKVGDELNLHFEQPRTQPSRLANDGDPITTGSFSLSLLIVGYDEYGALLVRIIQFGTITW